MMHPTRSSFKSSQDSVPLWFFAFMPYKLGEGLFIVLFPLFIVQVIGGTVANVATAHAAIALIGMLGFILWGNLSDWSGSRRPFLIIGFLGFALCIPLIGCARSLTDVLLISTLAGFFIAAITPVSSALVLDNFPEEEWAKYFGRFYQISGWSFVASLLLGITWLTVLPQWWGTSATLRGLMIFAGAIASLSFILCLLWIKEPPTVRKHRQFRPQLLGRLTVAVVEKRATFYPTRLLYFFLHPPFLAQVIKQWKKPLGRYYLCSLLLFISFNLIFVPLPIFLTKQLNVTNAQIFSINLAKAALETGFYVPIGHWLHKHPGIRLQAQATAARCGIFSLFTLLAFVPSQSNPLIIVAIAQILSGITWAAISISGTTVVATLAPKDKEGLAIGAYNAIVGASTAVGSFGSGYFAATFGYGTCFGLATLLAGLSSLWLWRLKSVVASGH